MIKLTDEMKDMIGKQLAYVATVRADGVPNIGPKRSLRVFDDSTLIYKENTGKEIWSCIQRGSKVAVAVCDREKVTGFRFICSAEYFTEGELFEKEAPKKAVVLLKIEEIYNLQVGENAGTRIA